jgi:hypothetical protein
VRGACAPACFSKHTQRVQHVQCMQHTQLVHNDISIRIQLLLPSRWRGHASKAVAGCPAYRAGWQLAWRPVLRHGTRCCGASRGRVAEALMHACVQGRRCWCWEPGAELGSQRCR